MNKLDKNSWVKTTFVKDIASGGGDFDVYGKIMGAPRFNESVYYVKYYFKDGTVKKEYVERDSLFPATLQEVVKYQRENNIELVENV